MQSPPSRACQMQGFCPPAHLRHRFRPRPRLLSHSHMPSPFPEHPAVTRRRLPQYTRQASETTDAGATTRQATVSPKCSFQPANKNDGDDNAPWNILTERVSKMREKEIARDRRIAQNWQNGIYRQSVIATVSEDYYRKLSIHDDFLACGTATGAVCIHHMPTGKSLKFSNVHIGQVTAIQYNESFVASAGSSDKTIALWACEKYERAKFWNGLSGMRNKIDHVPHHYINAHDDIITKLIVDSKNNRLYSAGCDGFVHIHQLSDATYISSIQVGEPVFSMVLTEKNYLLVGCASGKVKAYQAARGLFLISIQCHKSNTTAIDFFEDNQTLVTGDARGNIRVWSFKDSVCLGEIPSHDAAVMSIQIDHAKIVSAARDGCVAVSSLTTMKRVFAISGFTKYLTTAVFDDARLIADGSNDKIICHSFDVGMDP